MNIHTFQRTHNTHTYKQQTAFSLKHAFGLFYPQILAFRSALTPHTLASSLVAVVRIAERLGRVGIAFWFPQSLLSGSQQDSSLIVTTGAVLQIRGAHRRWQGLMLWAGVGEWMRDIARVQNKGGSGGEGVGEVVLDWRWTYGWNWSSRKVSSRDQGEEIANLDRGIKAVKSGSGGRDFEIGIRAGRWQTEQENRTKPSLFCLHTALVQYLEDCIRKHRS